jgi:hypothetical protein
VALFNHLVGSAQQWHVAHGEQNIDWHLHEFSGQGAGYRRGGDASIYEGLGTKKEKWMKKSGSQKGESASQLIDARIQELGDWRGKMLSRLRSLIKQADPEVVEEWKWRGVPVWSHDGLICTGETYKNVVKMTFAKGAALKESFSPLQLQS